MNTSQPSEPVLRSCSMRAISEPVGTRMASSVMSGYAFFHASWKRVTTGVSCEV
jgi:hypothetical protein